MGESWATGEPAGEAVWRRQARLRELRREGDELAEAQRAQYAVVLEAAKHDRGMVEAAFRAGFVDSVAEGTLDQEDVAKRIREQAERVGVPWRGLAVEEMMELMKETADGKRQDLAKLLDFARHLRDGAQRVAAVSRRREGLLDSACEATVADIRRQVAKLVAQLQIREHELVGTALKVAEDRKALLKRCREVAAAELQRARDLIEQGAAINAKDDLGFLSELHASGSELDAVALSIDGRLREAAEVQRQDALTQRGKSSKSSRNETKQGEEAKAQTGESKASGEQVLGYGGADEGKEEEEEEEEDEQRPQIEFSFDPFLVRRVALFGTVGNLHAVAPERLGEDCLQWDDVRSDTHLIGLRNAGTEAFHSGTRDARATVFGRNGFAKGSVVLRMRISGVESGQWVALGLATAADLNLAKVIRDSIIFEVAPRCGAGDQPELEMGTVRDNTIVTLVLDCVARRVEYYKGDVRIKVARLERGNPSKAEHAVHFFPYCTLFHPGQCVGLIR